jgi:hypothetical protein
VKMQFRLSRRQFMQVLMATGAAKAVPSVPFSRSVDSGAPLDVPEKQIGQLGLFAYGPNGFTELEGVGYERADVEFGPAQDGSLVNVNTVSFPQAVGIWTITHVGIFAEDTLLTLSQLPHSVVLRPGDNASAPPDYVRVAYR